MVKDGKAIVTMRQTRLAQELMKEDQMAKTKEALLIKVGYTPASAQAKSGDIFSSKGLQQALANLGVTADKLLKPASDALEATQGAWYQGKFYKSDDPDHNIRLKGADQIAEVLGIKKTIVENRNTNVNVDYTDIVHLV